MKYLSYDNISIDKIVDELFDFSKPGGISIANFISEEAREELLDAIRPARHLFKVSIRERGEVRQEMGVLYFEDTPYEIIPKNLKQRIRKLSDEYEEFYNVLGKQAGFAKTYSTVGIHIFPKGSLGITPHQDFTADTNLISSLLIAGSAPFYVCSNRNKDNSKDLEATPGTLVLMRAARTEEEQSRRPFHYVIGPMKEDRYSILMRNRKK